MNTFIRNISAICLLLFFATSATKAQNGQIKGRISIDNFGPASFVSVVLKEAGRQANTDEQGNFLFKDVKPGKHTLHVHSLTTSDTLVTAWVRENEVAQVVLSLKSSVKDLGEVVVTGQFGPTSVTNSVYQVRTISSERIQLRGATNLPTILNTELGIRFSNDLTLGTSDIELMGMSGQNVKILVDGIPMLDRGSTRESLGQIDVNSIERIEIVEGPMSVIYGTDALAGVINIITRKKNQGNKLSVTARMQEETVGKEYNLIQKKGIHNESAGLNWGIKNWHVNAGVSRNNFGGWQDTLSGRAKRWHEKDQMLFNAGFGYANKKLNAWYKFNGTDESIISLGDIKGTNAQDKKYLSKRWFHQAQADITASDRLGISIAASYTDYSRRTQTTNMDVRTGQKTLALDAGSQDKSIFGTSFFRTMVNYRFSSKMQLLAGIDATHNTSSGARIEGSPKITEAAVFLSPEFHLGQLHLKPGLRFMYNSIYDAPPVIPSINAKWNITNRLDLRGAYARGFRSPALRELYFTFFDASHSIRGNTNLKAEYSNSYNAFLSYRFIQSQSLTLNSVLGGFYSDFRDLIDTAIDPNDPSITTYVNIATFKTTGFSLNNTLSSKNLTVALGFQYIGRFNQLSADESINGAVPDFNWAPEINGNIIYRVPTWGLSTNLSWKYSGRRQRYYFDSSSGNPILALARVSDFNMADLTVSKSLGTITLTGGIRNLFNVTSLLNSSMGGESAHDPSGPARISYGRSYFLGISYNWTKK